jgi:carboxyl-terminal processing protease
MQFKMLKNKIAYIKLSNFHTDTPAGFLKIARETLRKNPRALILDVRNNPGGFLDGAVDIARHFIPQGVIVKEKIGEKNGQDYTVNGPAILKDLKTIVLVNEGSASASEIVAGALQDYKKAIILGEKTFGKGSIQDFRDLEDGSSIKFTIAEWLTPNSRSINEKGIVPDIVVPLTPEDYNNDRDPQLDKAVELLSK